MCKYCEKELTYFDVNNDSNPDSVAIEAVLDTSYWHHPYIQMETTVYAGVFGSINIESNFEVNYCPFCGRKLEDN